MFYAKNALRKSFLCGVNIRTKHIGTKHIGTKHIGSFANILNVKKQIIISKVFQ